MEKLERPIERMGNLLRESAKQLSSPDLQNGLMYLASFVNLRTIKDGEISAVQVPCVIEYIAAVAIGKVGYPSPLVPSEMRACTHL